MGIYFGVDYYPEHWPRARWETDAELMAEMGVDMVRMAEFSWQAMEPAEGDFRFEWLEEAAGLLGARGIKTVLGTPSAAPPAWIIRQTPEILPVDFHGVRCGFGGRHHDCQSNAVYRRHVRRFVTAMARRFAGNPNVIGWQTDNELGNSHADLCYCDSCAEAFRRWLEAKYGDVEALNRAWGTWFWSQGYDSFAQIDAPRHTVAGHNPSTLLDWRRFCSDLIVDFQREQLDILRALCPDQFITHNAMGFADKVNYFDLAKDLDFISHDQYPAGFFSQQPQVLPDELAARLDLMRGIKQRSFWVMEQQAGITGWTVMGRRPEPGQLSLWAAQSIAHGADAVVFFRWRTCTAGTEQYWHGVLPHSGRPGGRYAELKAFIGKMRPLMPGLQGAMPRAEVGMVYSYDQNYALQIQPHHPDLSYVGHLLRYYGAFYRRNVPVDFVSDGDDFSRYKLLVAPLQYLLSPALAEKYAAYVAAGGQLVLTMRSGVKDTDNICWSNGELPGPLRELLGIEIPDYDCLRETTVAVKYAGKTLAGELWADLIECGTAQPLGHYCSESYAGTAAMTLNSFGKGKAWYVGTQPDETFADELAAAWLEAAGVEPICAAPGGVEVARRAAQDRVYYFVMNHTGQPQAFVPPAGWRAVGDALDGELAPYKVAVFTE